MSASAIAPAVSSTSNGFTPSACWPIRPYAPALRESTSAPRRRFRIGPSIATRFIPSYTGFTSSASYSPKAATTSSYSSFMRSSIGVHEGVPNASLMRSASCTHSSANVRYSSSSTREGLSIARNRTRPCHSGRFFRKTSYARNPRGMFFVSSSRSTRSSSFASPRHRSRSARARRTAGCAAAARSDAASTEIG